MSPSAPAVLVMARAPRPGEVRRELEPLLGAPGCAALQAALIRAAVSWAHAVAPGAVQVAHDPADAGDELRRLIGRDAILFPQQGGELGPRAANAAEHVLSAHDGPLLIVWPDLPHLSSDHATAALGDLQAGCDVVFGPVIDGGFYLVGIPSRRLAFPVFHEPAWSSPDAITAGLAAAHEAGLEVGILRSERALRRPADVAAALADPLLAAEVGRMLEGTGGTPMS